MDKNNDIKVNKVSKWEAAPKSIHSLYLNLIDKVATDDNWETFKEIYLNPLEAVLNDYNELEAKHNADCGLISKLEEENRNLKSELDIITDENDGLISRVFKQDEEYQKLEAKYTAVVLVNKEIHETDEFHQKIHRKVQDEYNRIATENADLRSQCESKDDALQKMIKEVAELEKEKIDLEVRLAQSDELRYRSAKYAWAIKTILKKATFSPGHVAEELRFMARESTTPKDVQERWETYADEFLGEHSKLVEEINQLEKKNEELENALNDKKVTTWEEIDGKNKLIDELDSKIRMLKLREFMRSICYGYGLNNAQYELNRKIKKLEKENKDLKDTLEKDREFGKYIGKCVADSIREGCDKGVYKLHSCTKIDIHVEETNNMPMTFDRHAIPRIAVIFNNTQTEMERDTAEHECKELDKKFKELVKENVDLRTTLALCERDANAARNLCHNIAFNAERARNKTPWFNDTSV